MNVERYKSLWGSVLMLAVKDHCVHTKKQQLNKHGDKRKLTITGYEHHATQWIYYDSRVYANSFENICLLLDLDPRKIRSKLRMRSTYNAVQKLSRSNFFSGKEE